MKIFEINEEIMREDGYVYYVCYVLCHGMVNIEINISSRIFMCEKC